MKIDNDPKFWSDATVLLADEPEQTFKARFRVLPSGKTEALDMNKSKDVRQFLGEALVDVADIEDEDGNPLALQETLRDTLLGYPHYRAALLRAYAEGVTAARRGN
ncbi:MAG: hypothetical protein KDJ90_12750 [Nitratireductor sp.]|nr:hypothetical protein [Nitratireductor sp.]